jgi:hypothetical protein
MIHSVKASPYGSRIGDIEELHAVFPRIHAQLLRLELIRAHRMGVRPEGWDLLEDGTLEECLGRRKCCWRTNTPASLISNTFLHH